MRVRSWIAIVGLSVAAMGWAFTRIRDGQRHSQREIDRLTAALAQVQTELQHRPGSATTDGDADRRVIGHAAQVARAEARAEAMAALAEQDPGDEAHAQRPPPITFEESQQRVLSAFAAETVDSRWAPDAARKLEGIVRSHLPAGSRLRGVECRSSMCEVSVTHADATAQEGFLMNGFRGWPGSLFVTDHKQEQGEIVVTVIAAREGTEPPIAPR